MLVGWMYQPPMTEDMKWLLSQKLLVLGREFVFSHRRQNVLAITEKGRLALSRTVIRRADRSWVEAAYSNNMLT